MKCGFEAVNSDHCWISGHCIVCGINIDNKIYFTKLELMWGDKTLERADADGDITIHNLDEPTEI